MIVCVTGTPAAGKSSVGKVLSHMGFKIYELGDIVRRMMRDKEIALTPESDRKFTIWLRKSHGRLVTVRKLASEVDLSRGRNIAIIGVRSKPELDYIRKKGKTVAIAIIAPSRLRFQRMRKRGRADAQKTYADFVKRDKKEERFGLWGAIESADYVISGTSTIPQLTKEVRQIVRLASQSKAF